MRIFGSIDLMCLIAFTEGLKCEITVRQDQEIAFGHLIIVIYLLYVD